MARRGGGAWRVPGNPLVGMMRDAARQSRKGGRRRPAVGGQEQEPPQGPAAPTVPPSRPAPGPLATVAVTDAAGRASWTYSSAFPAAPVVTAAVQELGGAGLFAVVEEADRTAVTVRVWHAPAAAGAVPAGPGVAVHLAATPVRP